MRFVWVTLAGAAGTLTRYVIALAIGAEFFPWSTLLVNITGSFGLALVVTLGTERILSVELATAVTVGFMGAYTTFSTLAWEAFVLNHTHRRIVAAVYVGVSIVGGLMAAWAGYQLARAMR